MWFFGKRKKPPPAAGAVRPTGSAVGGGARPSGSGGGAAGTSGSAAGPAAFAPGSGVLLKGRTKSQEVEPVVGATLLELAEANKLDWLSNCRRGTCARCRCLVTEGMERLSPPNEAETDRLLPEELERGYRLGCQAKVERAGRIAAKHAPYF